MITDSPVLYSYSATAVLVLGFLRIGKWFYENEYEYGILGAYRNKPLQG